MVSVLVREDNQLLLKFNKLLCFTSNTKILLLTPTHSISRNSKRYKYITYHHPRDCTLICVQYIATTTQYPLQTRVIFNTPVILFTPVINSMHRITFFYCYNTTPIFNVLDFVNFMYMNGTDKESCFNVFRTTSSTTQPSDSEGVKFS